MPPTEKKEAEAAPTPDDAVKEEAAAQAARQDELNAGQGVTDDAGKVPRGARQAAAAQAEHQGEAPTFTRERLVSDRRITGYPRHVVEPALLHVSGDGDLTQAEAAKAIDAFLKRPDETRSSEEG